MLINRRKLNTTRFISIVLVLALTLQLFSPALTTGKVYAGFAGASKSEASSNKFSSAFDGMFSFNWFLQKFGINLTFHLIECAEEKKKPDFFSVVKSMATVDFAARSLGGTTGYAAGSVVAAGLSTIPIVGGMLAGFVPTFSAFVGGEIAGRATEGVTNKEKGFKNFFKDFDWTGMMVGSLGWYAGSIIGSAILPPIGGIVGGIIGNVIAGKILNLFRKDPNKNPQPPTTAMPTGEGLPHEEYIQQTPKTNTINAPVIPEYQSSSPVTSASAAMTDSEIENDSAETFSDTEANGGFEIRAMMQEYKALYSEYQESLKAQAFEKCKNLGKRLDHLKTKIENAYRK
ncbi:MAG: hypothetical protein ACQETH_01970 [Candidatus Rifleibacteriota bacterium]